MLNIVRAAKIGAALIVGAVMLSSMPSPSYAETGAVRFSVGSAGFIVGIGGGSGALRFRGKTYRLSIGGVRIGTIGASATEVRGVAYNMRRPSDIAGTYSAVGAGLAVGGGAGSARLQNEKGVVLDVRAVKVGLEANLNLGGVSISLQ
ncbi:hypothetical protein [Rhodoplanes sp. Z2-YC6860]|uniref:hypothetical protein n=1 Tax=Rhodoplanes sp. Z2-YC6860 TaxID=674703 RepID=UPI00078CA457|nr:hypothetical protein [Rhodoplanes sp. Z2-YC6860]AMN43827.1 hypothetical protein RHPLAN_54110 [Rhodoplanes sp. Z2-YC6860]